MTKHLLHDRLITAAKIGRSVYWATRAQVLIAINGRKAPVSRSCQIPNIRQKLVDLSLNEHTGCFVEIGAYDGESMSNTSFLADQGWRGIYVEPIRRYYRMMKLRHLFNRVKGENVAISDTAGAASIADMHALSTMNKATSEHYRSLEWARSAATNARIAKIKTATLDDVLSRNDVPDDLELMVIDVEGSEETIVSSLLRSRWRPRVLIVELCDVHPDFAQNDELSGSAARVRSALIADGYLETFIDNINTIFVRRR